jgi:hypothetical protein
MNCHISSKITKTCSLKKPRGEQDSPHHEALSITRARGHFETFYKGPVMNHGPSKTQFTRGPMLSINKLRASKMPRGMRRGDYNTCEEWSHFARECI